VIRPWYFFPFRNWSLRPSFFHFSSRLRLSPRNDLVGRFMFFVLTCFSLRRFGRFFLTRSSLLAISVFFFQTCRRRPRQAFQFCQNVFSPPFKPALLLRSFIENDFSSRGLRFFRGRGLPWQSCLTFSHLLSGSSSFLLAGQRFPYKFFSILSAVSPKAAQ